MLFSEYLVYGSKEEEKEDGEFREEEIEEEEIEEAQMNEDEEKSEDEEDWEAKRQEWVEYFRHRDLANWFKGKHYQTDEYNGKAR
jgi:predicted transcriptional regulator